MINFWSVSRIWVNQVGGYRWLVMVDRIISTLKIPSVWWNFFSVKRKTLWKNWRQWRMWKHYPNFHSLGIKPPTEWFLGDRIAFRKKVVLEIGLWCHTKPDTWRRVGTENHPHRTLKFKGIWPCDIQLSHPFLQG